MASAKRMIAMANLHYTLTVRTSPSSATAFSLRAPGDDAAISLAWRVVGKLADLCGKPRFEVTRQDGSLVCHADDPSRATRRDLQPKAGDATKAA